MGTVPLIEEALTGSIIGAFYDVYNEMGYGYLERIYIRALERELVRRGHKVAREVEIVILYRGEPLGIQRLDMIVDDRIVVETKSTERLPQAALRQLFSYLKASRLEVGLLLHFGPDPKFYRQIFHHRPVHSGGCRSIRPPNRP